MKTSEQNEPFPERIVGKRGARPARGKWFGLEFGNPRRATGKTVSPGVVSRISISPHPAEHDDLIPDRIVGCGGIVSACEGWYGIRCAVSGLGWQGRGTDREHQEQENQSPNERAGARGHRTSPFVED